MEPRYSRADLLARRGQPGLRHPAFGDLQRLDAVRYPEPWIALEAVTERSPYTIHISVTGRCNARCRGCVNSAITLRGAERLPADMNPERDSLAIAALLRDVPDTDVLICLYGGEPLLVPDKALALMSRLETLLPGRSVRYMLYTNGQLLHEMFDRAPGLLAKVWLLSVSIDGQAEQHQAVRPGTLLARIEAGLERLRDHPGRGPVLMWSTLREDQSLADCYAEFRRLHERGVADQFFWHWVETDEPFGDLAAYAQRYEEDYRHILDDYVAWVERGEVPPIPHLNELVLYLLTGRERGTSACGVEVARNYDILGGKIHACADLPLEWAIGSIADDGTPTVREADLGALVAYKDDLGCSACGVHGYCGGRCPVQGLTAQATRLQQYCQLPQNSFYAQPEALKARGLACGVGVVVAIQGQARREWLRFCNLVAERWRAGIWTTHYGRGLSVCHCCR